MDFFGKVAGFFEMIGDGINSAIDDIKHFFEGKPDKREEENMRRMEEQRQKEEELRRYLEEEERNWLEGLNERLEHEYFQNKEEIENIKNEMRKRGMNKDYLDII